MTAAERIFLVGSMGAGKSAVGRTLARLMRYTFVDTDHEIEAQAGVDVSFIFDKEGEAGFRTRETRVLEALATRPQLVVATGGGCVVVERNREILGESGLVVYLSASVDQLYERVRYGSHRPLLLTDDPKTRLAEILTEREPLYRDLADIEIDTEGKRVRAVALATHERIKRFCNDREASEPDAPD